jgi:protein-L-isoaspartate(D-aspartate) O-methyltransferase
MKDFLISRWSGTKFVKNRKIIDAFIKIPREEFVPAEFRFQAYNDTALPTYEGQTISQPTTIMIMMDSLELTKKDKVLEIGAGSGYQAALLSLLCKKVYSFENNKTLVEFARKNLEKINIKNAEVIFGDGSLGYEKAAPYDKIIVTAACPVIPEPLIKQLKEKGIIVAPVGNPFSCQMIKGRKIKGKLNTESLGYFSFVPLKGKHGYK